MPSVTSCFNRTLFKGALRRNWPLWCGYAILLILVIPCSLGSYLAVGNPSFYDIRSMIMGTSHSAGITISAISGIIFAMAMFAYLGFPRSTGGMHALPLRRDNLFLSHYLAGLFAQISTQVVTFVIATLICLPQIDAKALAVGFASFALPTVFFYSFGVLCMHCTGQVLAAPVFYGVFNFLAVALETAVESVASLFLYGYCMDNSSFVCEWLSPTVSMFRNVTVDRIYDDAGQIADVCFNGLSCYVIYAAIGVVLAAIAFLLYRKRKSEHSGNTVVFSWMYPVFQYGVALCAAFSVGIAIYWIFFNNQIDGHGNLIGAIVSLSAGALLGFYAASMILKKSFRVFRKSLWSIIGIVAVISCFCVCLDLDVTGYEKTLPDADAIENVEVNVWSSGDYTQGALDDPETIDSLLALHAVAISPDGIAANNAYYEYERDNILDSEKVNFAEIRIFYNLKDGTHCRRSYTFRLPQQENAADDKLTRAFLDFFAQKEVVCAYMLDFNPTDLEEDRKITGGQCIIFADDRYDSRNFGLSAEEAQKVFDTAMRDVEAGHYRQLTPLFYGDDQNLACCDINFLTPREQRMQPYDARPDMISLRICAEMKETIPLLEKISGIAFPTSRNSGNYPLAAELTD